MDDIMKAALEDAFTYNCFSISETGVCNTLFFVIKKYEIFPILLDDGVEMPINKYLSLCLKYATDNDSDAVLLIGEQFMVKGKKDDAIMKQLLSGEMKASDHPDRKPFLVLSYMTAEGVVDLLFGEIKTSVSGTKYVTDQKWTFNAATSVLVPWR